MRIYALLLLISCVTPVLTQDHLAVVPPDEVTEATYTYSPALTLEANTRALFEVLQGMTGPTDLKLAEEDTMIFWLESEALDGGPSIAHVCTPFSEDIDWPRLLVRHAIPMHPDINARTGRLIAHEFNNGGVASAYTYIEDKHWLMLRIHTDLSPITADHVSSILARALTEQELLMEDVAKAVGLRDPEAMFTTF
jgi:hypothetical protein